MKYTIQGLQLPIIWAVGNKPKLSGGKFYADGKALSAALFGATIQLLEANAAYLSETPVVLDGSDLGAFSFTFPSEFVYNGSGKLVFNIFLDSGVTATIDAGVTAAAGQTVDVTATAGTVPAAGYCIIGSEWCKYTLSGSTITLTERGLYNTTAASHSMSDAITFSEVKELVNTSPEYTIKTLLRSAAN